jgi:hypothetical protein
MHPALPEEPADLSVGSPDREARYDDASPNMDVGAFEQGSPVSRWALARYLVGRAVAESVSRSLLLVGVVLLVLAVLSQALLHTTVLTVLIVIVAAGVFLLRAVLGAVLRRLTAADQVGPLESRLRALVSDTRKDVLRELRRVGLPGRTWTLPVLAFRLLGKRRRATVERLREFDLDRAVPRARLDELHLLLRSVVWRGGAGW